MREPDTSFGRDDQWRTIATALADPRQPSRTLFLEGEAGIGKTALVRATIAEAERLGYRVLRASPIESEAGLALTGLGDLLEPVLPHVLPALPAPLRDALEIALLLRAGDGVPPDQRALGVAVLHGLHAIAEGSSVLVAIDDAHWLDGVSAEVLRFAFRRLRAEPVVVLLARRPMVRDRPNGLDDAGLPSVERIALGPLSLGALHAMVHERLGVSLSRPDLRRVHELSGGNPLFALELVRGSRDGTLDLADGAILSPGLDALIGRRLRTLPDTTRDVLAIAAGASRPLVVLVERASRGVDVRRALAPAIDAGIASIVDDEIVFAHPLIASAAIGTLDAADRRSVHARLAAVVDDPVEHARHLAHAVTEPDAAVASEVEEAATLTRARGAASGAADLMHLALRLTPVGDAARTRRTLAEADHRLESGDAPGASRVLEQLVAAIPAGAERAVALARLARVRQLAADTGGGIELLHQALDEADRDDPIRAEAHEALAWALILVRHALPEALTHARAAVEGARAHDDVMAEARALAAVSLAATLLGQPDDGAMDRALALEGRVPGRRVLRDAAYAAGYRLTCLDELAAADQTYADLLTLAERLGDEASPGHILGRRAVVRMLSGDLADAERMASEAVELSGQTGQLPTQASALGRLALVLARQGELDRAATLADRGLELATTLPSGVPDRTEVAWWARPHARGGELPLWALGHIALCRERWDEAADLFGRLTDPIVECGVREPGDLRWLLDEVEALVLSGRTNEGEARARLAAEMATMVGRPSAWAVSHAARGILDASGGRLEAALSGLTAAAACAEDAPLPFERARILLLLGRVQRRLARKRDARATLERAASVFAMMRARHWVETCRAELGRIGGRSAGGSELTEAERRVVDLVAQGRTNKEVAAALFVTPKAVEASLSRIYAKQGVGSRTELLRRMAGP